LYSTYSASSLEGPHKIIFSLWIVHPPNFVPTHLFYFFTGT